MRSDPLRDADACRSAETILTQSAQSRSRESCTPLVDTNFHPSAFRASTGQPDNGVRSDCKLRLFRSFRSQHSCHRSVGSLASSCMPLPISDGAKGKAWGMAFKAMSDAVGPCAKHVVAKQGSTSSMPAGTFKQRITYGESEAQSVLGQT